MTQTEFKNILVETGLNVYHNIADEDDGNYIVWGLSGFNYICSDNYVEERNAIYIVNYYSKVEYDETFLVIESVFDNHRMAYSPPSIVYDVETNITIYSYKVEVGYNANVTL